jgi:anti-anti-sigma regulatory factor
LDEILTAIYHEASQVMDTTGFGVALHDPAKDEIRFELFIDQGEQLDKFTKPMTEPSLNAWVIQNKQSIFVRDPNQDAYPIQDVIQVGHNWLPQSFIGVPLIYKERAIGVISAQSEKPLAFDLHQKRVLEGIAHLAAPALENARLLQQLQLAIDKQAQLLTTIQELGSPLIPIAEGIVVLPLVGHIDQLRAQSIMENLLMGITAHRAEVVLIDITGVSTVDTTVANSLMQSAKAANLLGSQVILVGIRPEVAQTIVNLGIDLQGMTNFANLQTGIQAALGMRGWRIVPKP